PAGRADGRAGRRPDPAGARPGPEAGRAGPGRRAHQPQHGGRLRGRRPDRHPLPGPDGRAGADQGRDPRPGRRVDHRGPVGCPRPAASRERGHLMPPENIDTAKSRPEETGADKTRTEETRVERTAGAAGAAERAAPASARAADFGLDTTALTTGEAIQAYVRNLRNGELGALPALLGLAALFVLFTVLDSGGTFLSLLNLANLLQQGAGQTIIAMGLVFVLLTGEIDLAAGTASGLAAAVMALHLVSGGNLLGGMGTTVFVLFCLAIVLAIVLALMLRIWFGAAL